jgi:hypothetical protein
MANELQSQCTAIAAQVDQVAALAPQVIVEYRDKLLQRVNELVRDLVTRLGPADLLMEVALHADRCVITPKKSPGCASHLSLFLMCSLSRHFARAASLISMCQELISRCQHDWLGNANPWVSPTALSKAKVCVRAQRKSYRT